MSSEPVPSASVLAGLRLALKPHAPFAAMRVDDVGRIVRASTLRYFAPGEVILDPSSGRAEHCYVIRQGGVGGERPNAGTNAAPLWELSAGEMFPLGALLGQRAVTSVYRAKQDTFCLVFPAAVFDDLISRSHVFQDFCTRRLAHLLDLLRASLQSEYAAEATERLGFGTPIASALRRMPIVRGPDAELGETLAAMEDARVGCIPIVDSAGVPLGIFTRQDVIGRVVLAQRNLGAKMREVMSSPAITMRGEANLGEAALLMTQRGIRHVIVVDDGGRIAGVVSERDLFSIQRLSVRDLASAVRRAPCVDELARCASDVRALSLSLVAQGVPAGQLTRMISSLNDQVAARLIELAATKHDLSGLALCWLGMGSEGRSEQTIATDQDNGIIFAVQDESAKPDTVRERLLPFAREVNAALERCGYPLCNGGYMAMNPRWCASLGEWSMAFAGWIDGGDPQSLLAAGVFFDFRALWGDKDLARSLREHVARRARANSRFLKQMSDNALRNRPPLSWRGELLATDSSSESDSRSGSRSRSRYIDLKIHGSVPFVDAARILALATGVTATNTVERLEKSADALGIPAQEIRGWCDAFEYVQLLRLREQHRRIADGPGSLEQQHGEGENPNAVPLELLSDLDRRILKEAMRQIRKLQQRLELDYPG